MTVKFKLLTPTATLPTRAHDTDSGMDVYADEDCAVFPNHNRVVKTGLAAVPPPCYELQLRPRSGLAARSAIVAAFGTIDNGYRGEIGVDLFNHSSCIYHVHKGDKIAQIVPMRVDFLGIEETDTIDETERGAGGFGSTGMRDFCNGGNCERHQLGAEPCANCKYCDEKGNI